MAGREKASMGKRNKRPKENAESEKRMSILLLFWEMTELPLVNRWKGIRKFWWGKTGRRVQGETEPRYKAKQGRAQGKTGPGARQNRAGYKAKQGPGARRNRARVQGKQGRMQTPGLQAKIPFDGKRPKMPLKAFFPYLGVTFPVLLNTELKTGILTGLRRSRGDYDIPLSKATTEKRPAGIDRALFCWTEGIMNAHSRFRYRFRRRR